jgi:hypothetical protein
MGCQLSKDPSHHILNHADDSVKVALRHDQKVAKQHGEASSGYRPRDPNPLLDRPSSTDPVSPNPPPATTTTQSQQIMKI